MSKHDDYIYLFDMLNHAREAVELLADKNQDQLAADRLLQLALTRLLEIIGEAGNRVSTQTQQKNKQVPWKQIIGMRNRLIHGYDVIDYQLVWNTVRYDLPSLIRIMNEICSDSNQR